jgi:hypothetical protein
MLKRLQRYKIERVMPVAAFERNTFDLFNKKYNINTPETAVVHKGKIFVTVEFSDVDMEKVVATINSEPLTENM